MTFTDIQLSIVSDGGKPYIDPDIREVMAENPDLWECPSGCNGKRQLRGWKRPGEYRAFLICIECGQVEEL